MFVMTCSNMTAKIFFISIIALLTLGCKGQDKTEFNLDFEEKHNDKSLSEGWFKWGRYKVVSDTVSYSGKYSAKITSDKNGSSYGGVVYEIPLLNKGDSISLEGYIKTLNVDGSEYVEKGFAGLMLRIVGKDKSLAFNNMERQNLVGTKDWKKYAISLPLPNDAEKVYLGGVLVGNGVVWFDSLNLKIDGKNIDSFKNANLAEKKTKIDSEFDSGSRIQFNDINEALVKDLKLTGKVWGFLKYHHPNITNGNYNWDYELFRFLSSLETKKTDDDINLLILKWIGKYGTLQECKDCYSPNEDAVIKPDLAWLANKNSLGIKLQRKLKEIHNSRNIGDQHYIGKDSKTGKPIFENEKTYYNMSYPDQGFRLLALYKFWNIVNYFYPYKDLIDTNWDDILTEYIPVFLNAKNELEYELAILQLLGEVSDSHTNIWAGGDKVEAWKGTYYPPVHIRFVEGQFVVSDYYNQNLENNGGVLKVGDVITRINGEDISQYVQSIKKYYPASNGQSQFRDISEDILRSQESKMQLSFKRDGVLKDTILDLYPLNNINKYRLYRRHARPSYKLLENNIGYVTLENIEYEDIPKIQNEFMSTKAIIIDIRNYPSAFVPFYLGSFFISTPTPFVKFSNFNVDNPGEFNYTLPIMLNNMEKNYLGKVIIIVNEITQSQAEYTAMAFQASKNALLIGGKTAGTDGNISRLNLPGGIETAISGIGVYYPNGKETQRIGLVPDFEIYPTIDGVKNGRDELLEYAIKLCDSL